MIYSLGKEPLIAEEERLFMMEAYKWLLRNFGGEAFYKKTPLILPTEAFFPELFNSQGEIAETAFKYVQKYAGMEKWPCELKAQDFDPEQKVSPSIISQRIGSHPLGSFSDKNPDKVVITYNTSLVSRPNQLIATFAHELAHYLTGGCMEAPPGGWENWEATTDVAAVFMGFGVFMANSVFTFTQYAGEESYGCCSSRSGYLSEEALSFALGVFIKLKEINHYNIYRYLDPNIKAFLIKSLEELNKSKDYLELLDVEYTADGP